MNKEEIKNAILVQLPKSEVVVSGEDGVHFEVRVVSEQFNGLSLIERHRLIYQALGTKVGNEIHALSIKALVP